MTKRTNTLKVGDKVVHRHHGGGIICAIAEQTVNGHPAQYFVIENIIDGMKHYIPIQHAAEAQLSPVEVGITPEESLQNMLHEDLAVPADHNQLNEIVNEKIEEGSIQSLAIAVGMIYEYRKQESLKKRPISQLTRKVLQHAEKLLSSHIALIENINYQNAENQLHVWLDQAYPQYAA